MKNSILPILALAAILLSLPFCIAKGDGGGAHGPQVPYGIYQGEKKQVPNLPAVAPTIALAPLQSMRGVRQDDGRVGLEVVPWSETVLLAEDEQPLTWSMVKALAEQLSVDAAGQYRLVLVVQHGQDALPVPGLRVVRVATIEAQMPSQPGGACSAVLEVAVQDARGADLGDLRRQVGVVEAGYRLSLSVPAEELAPAEELWARWYATVGRALATELLTAHRGPVVELAWDDVGFRHRHADWGDAVPIAPKHKTLQWHAAWQDPLQRGWHGLMYGQRYIDRRGKEQDIAEDFARMLGRGEWQQEVASLDDAQRWVWPREAGLERFRLQRTDWGFIADASDLRADPASVIETWLTAGDRQLLRQHLNRPGIPDALRARMRAALEQDADLAERVALDPAGDEAAWVSYLRGSTDTPPHATLTPLATTTWDGRHRLGLVGDSMAVLVVDQADRQRMQLWWRRPGGQPMRSDVIDGVALLDGQRLQIGDGAIIVDQE